MSLLSQGDNVQGETIKTIYYMQNKTRSPVTYLLLEIMISVFIKSDRAIWRYIKILE